MSSYSYLSHCLDICNYLYISVHIFLCHSSLLRADQAGGWSLLPDWMRPFTACWVARTWRQWPETLVGRGNTGSEVRILGAFGSTWLHLLTEVSLFFVHAPVSNSAAHVMCQVLEWRARLHAFLGTRDLMPLSLCPLIFVVDVARCRCGVWNSTVSHLHVCKMYKYSKRKHVVHSGRIVMLFLLQFVPDIHHSLFTGSRSTCRCSKFLNVKHGSNWFGKGDIHISCQEMIFKQQSLVSNWSVLLKKQL